MVEIGSIRKNGKYKTLGKIIYPFCPGIPWSFRDELLVSKINPNHWHRIVAPNNFSIICYGTYMESLFSLYFFEHISKLYPDKRLTWIGDSNFSKIVGYNGVSRYEHSYFEEDLMKMYPAPLIIDRENQETYFNILFNTGKLFDYKGDEKEARFRYNTLILESICDNMFIDIDKGKTLPIRGFQSTVYDDWISKVGITDVSKCVIIAKRFFKTRDPVNYLRINNSDYMGIISRLDAAGFTPLIIGSERDSYLPFMKVLSTVFVPLDYEIITGLLMNCGAIISGWPEASLSAAMLNSDIKIISGTTRKRKRYSVEENISFFGFENDFLIQRELYLDEMERFIE